ncbi:MAG: hypothetical protein PHW04_18515 [Candidatus Wallbacteria bacterium]|nr:hypothetical protein [Candidatus Wallbacteria bacterium]
MSAQNISDDLYNFSRVYRQTLAAIDTLKQNEDCNVRHEVQTDLSAIMESQIVKICRTIVENDQTFSEFQEYISTHQVGDFLKPILENLKSAVLNSYLTDRPSKVKYLNNLQTNIKFKGIPKFLPREEQKLLLLTVRSIYGDADRCYCREIRQGSITGFFLELSKSWNMLYPEVQKDILKYSRDNLYSLRNRSGGTEETGEYKTAHFTVHYTKTGKDAVANPELLAVGIDGIRHPEFVINTGAFLEKAFQEETCTLCLKAPRFPYQVYLKDLGDGEYGATKVDDVSGKPTESYIEIDNDFKGSRYFQNDDCVRETGSLKVTAAHEFMHACQFMYGLAKGPAGATNCLSESTSTWAEDFVFDEVNDYLGFLKCDDSPFKAPYLEITSRSYSFVVFPLFLSEKFNPTIIRTLWENYQKSLDQVQAIKATLSDLSATYGDYSVALYLKKEKFRDGLRYPDLTIQKKINISRPVNEVINTNTPGYFGQNYVEIETSMPGALNLKFSSSSAYQSRLILIGDSTSRVVERSGSSWEFNLEYFGGTVKKAVLVTYCLEPANACTEFSLEASCAEQTPPLANTSNSAISG